MSNLAAYQRHLEKFGPELLLQTAATELDREDLGQLKAMIESMERTYHWRRGKWVERRQGERSKCVECGLDLPRNAPVTTLRHSHCRKAAQRKRKAVRAPAES